jgi:hypothetical protein
VGECDDDGQCAVGLLCFQRTNGEDIPGCSGPGSGLDWDYCYDPALDTAEEDCLFCDAGFYCGDGASSPTQNACGTGLTDPSGYYCPEGSSTATPVPEGFYSTPEDGSGLYRTGIATCPNGYFCPGQTGDIAKSGLKLEKIYFTSCDDFDVDEGDVATTAVGTVVAGHVQGYGLEYSIVAAEAFSGYSCDTAADQSSLFSMDAGTGAITLGSTIKFDPDLGGCPKFQLTVQATELAGGVEASSIQCNATVTVYDVNDPPSLEDGQVFYIVERSDINTAVTFDTSGIGDAAAVNGTDSDAGQELTFSITGGSTQVQDYFKIASCRLVTDISYCTRSYCTDILLRNSVLLY